MDIKYCNSCGQDNVLSAKFCMACRLGFPDIIVKVSNKPHLKKQVSKYNKIEVDDSEKLGEGDESDADIDLVCGYFDDPNAQMDFASSLIDRVISDNVPSIRERAIKIQDVIATAKKTEGKRDSGLGKISTQKDAKKIAEQMFKSTESTRIIEGKE